MLNVKWNQLKLGIALCCVYMRCVYVNVHLFACLCESVGMCSASVSLCMLYACVHACYASVYPYVHVFSSM